MDSLLKRLLPQKIAKFVRTQKSILAWEKNSFLENSPQLIKENVFLKYGIKNAPWIETGTYMGTTTKYLSNFFPHVYSIEP